jgi:hypothetical protein
MAAAMKTIKNEHRFDARDVVWFVKLHQDNAKEVRRKNETTAWYEVEGKSRPMLVLRRHGGACYNALEFSTVRPKNIKKYYPAPRSSEPMVFGSSMRFRADCYLKLTPIHLCHENLAGTLMTRIDPLLYSDILKKSTFAGLGYSENG